MDAITIIIIGIFILICVGVIRIPIIIAKRRGLTERTVTAIALLSWMSLLVGITWIVALIMSLIYHPQTYTDQSGLGELKEKGILTPEQFDKAKKRVLSK